MAGSLGAGLDTPLIILCFRRTINTTIIYKNMPSAGWVGDSARIKNSPATEAWFSNFKCLR